MKKDPITIKHQMLRQMGSLREFKCFILFDDKNITTSDLIKSFNFDSDELPVVLYKTEEEEWSVMTTKNLFIFRKEELLKIRGIDIDSVDFNNFLLFKEGDLIYQEKIRNENRGNELKKWLYSENLRIKVKDGNEYLLRFKDLDTIFIFNKLLYRLVFVTKKYN